MEESVFFGNCALAVWRQVRGPPIVRQGIPVDKQERPDKRVANPLPQRIRPTAGCEREEIASSINPARESRESEIGNAQESCFRTATACRSFARTSNFFDFFGTL